jgi:hypothetical protein
LESKTLAIINKSFGTKFKNLEDIEKMVIKEDSVNEDFSHYWKLIKDEGFPVLAFYPMLSVWMEIDKLLKGQSLAFVANYGDDIKSDNAYRSYSTWHYVNFPFDRLTQEHDLLYFESKGRKFFSYLMLIFWKGTLKSSNIYLIPIRKWLIEKQQAGKKSFNERDIDILFGEYNIEVLKGGIFNLEKYIF